MRGEVKADVSGTVPASPARRRYNGTKRAQTAQHTRIRILNAARELFLADGYTATTVTAVAARAGVATDTVYAAVGAKPTLFRALVENALSGADHAIEGADRDYAVRMRAEPDARRKLAIYASAVTEMQQRLAPLFEVLHKAASGQPELEQLWSQITERRARNMLILAGDLASTGALRADLSIQEAADIIWTTNGSEYYSLLVTDRGWTPERFAEWLYDAWRRLLLR